MNSEEKEEEEKKRKKENPSYHRMSLLIVSGEEQREGETGRNKIRAVTGGVGEVGARCCWGRPAGKWSEVVRSPYSGRCCADAQHQRLVLLVMAAIAKA